jgi:hypothetical protein
MTRPRAASLVFLAAVAALAALEAAPAVAQGFAEMRERALAEPFVGVTADGTVEPGLFTIRATGVSTGPVVRAAEAFLAALGDEQRERTTFAAADVEWRRWDNVHRAPRRGVRFGELDEARKGKAFALLGAGLSAKGLEKSRDVMKLNGHLADLVGDHDEYGEGLYYLTVMGRPSETEPWGWQLDGHHLAVNYFVLGDQVVMTPVFMGSEPVVALSGRSRGVSVMQDEQARGLSLVRALDEVQRELAILDLEKTRGNALAQAYQDNLVLDYAGLPASRLDAAQRQLLLDLVGEYVGNMDEGHARIRMEEVEAHLDETHFAWIGGTGEDAVFYYRVHSPVILIEFDHQGPIALAGDRGVPTRRHVHSVVRTPNGNDYGKDLLRQHYEAHAHDPGHGHAH